MLPASFYGATPPERFMKWVLRIVVAVSFISIGFAKFSTDPRSEWVDIFHRIGFGDWFRMATGIIEIVGGGLFLIPRASLAGGVILGVAMLGATIAHLAILGDPFSVLITLPLLAGVVSVAIWVQPESRGED